MVGFVLAIEQNHGFTCVIAWASGYARYHWQQIQMQIHSKHSAIFSAKENTQASEISLCLLESKLPPILISCKRVTDKLTSVDKVSDKSSLENTVGRVLYISGTQLIDQYLWKDRAWACSSKGGCQMGAHAQNLIMWQSGCVFFSNKTNRAPLKQNKNPPAPWEVKGVKHLLSLVNDKGNQVFQWLLYWINI